MTPTYITADMETILEEMEAFEASQSVSHTGTGSRREGEDFEKLIGRLWGAVRSAGEDRGAKVVVVPGVGKRRYAGLSAGPRSLFVPANDATITRGAAPPRWLEVDFTVNDLVAEFPGKADAIRDYAPKDGPYAGENYPTIYDRLKTRFDDTVVLLDGGNLVEKVLLEYKTAKSSKGRQIDGNAHERLSFQILQYLEVATRYTNCSLMVMANGAFVRYRNKYHVSFHMQAERLKLFPWFSMDHACTRPEYGRFLSGLFGWLFEGTTRAKGSA